MSPDIYFNTESWFPRNVCVKSDLNTQWPFLTKPTHPLTKSLLLNDDCIQLNSNCNAWRKMFCVAIWFFVAKFISIKHLNWFSAATFSSLFHTNGDGDSGMRGRSKVIYTKYSKQFKWNSYFYVSGQNRPFWVALKLL